MLDCSQFNRTQHGSKAMLLNDNQSETCAPFPEVPVFANRMLGQLHRNDRKGGWDDESTEYLFERLHEEVAELSQAVSRGGLVWMFVERRLMSPILP